MLLTYACTDIAFWDNKAIGHLDDTIFGAQSLRRTLLAYNLSAYA